MPNPFVHLPTDTYRGEASIPTQSRSKGVLTAPVVVKDFGAIPVLLATGLISAATSAEVPNAATITYTPATDGTSPLDAGTRYPVVTIIDPTTGQSVACWDLGVARNVSFNVTHASSIVAMSSVVSGYDDNRMPMSEAFAVTATGTTKTDAGAKAFRYVKSISLTAAGDATANTVNVGTGTVYGLPVKITSKNHVLAVRMDGADDNSATIVVGDGTSPATTSTGDVRGTIDFNSDPDGTRTYLVAVLADPSSAAALYGVAQV